MGLFSVNIKLFLKDQTFLTKKNNKQFSTVSLATIKDNLVLNITGLIHIVC